MVLSRYVAVLRGANKSLRRSLLETEVNLKISLRQPSANFRFSAIRSEGESEILQNSVSATPALFPENVQTVNPNILRLASQSPSAYDSKLDKEDDFGEQHFISDSKSSKDDGIGREHFTSDDIWNEDDFKDCKGLPGALDTCDEDISHITRFHKPSFNFAAYADDSPTIKKLADLGVELYKIEKKFRGMEVLLRRTFDDMKPYIQFLHDSGVLANDIGAFITKNPYIFTQDMDDLHTRIRYLRAHKFNTDSVARIVTRNPYWLMFKTKKIDERLGHFQQEFKLNGMQVRALATREPRVITYSMKHITENTFALREEMGFEKQELKALLLMRPGLLMKSRNKLVAVFDYIHNTMGLSHEILLKQPMILTCRMERLRNRHKYIESLGKNQYDPTKPLYVSPNSIVGGTDEEFCRDVAKTTVETYNLYLKSL